jgi:hypothetical protein
MKWGIERSETVTRMAHLPGCERFINRQYDRYLRVKFRTNWQLLRNPASHRGFIRSAPILNVHQGRMLAELNENGVAICHIDELFQEPGLWERLSDQVRAFSESERTRAYIQNQQNAFDSAKDPNAVAHYIFTYYDPDQKPLIDANSPLFELATSSEVLDLVDSYLGLWSRLIYFDLWHTVPLKTETRILSQRWHRDPEDRKKIRIFLYYSYVDDQAGPMEYFAGSQLGGAYEHLFPWRDPLQMPYPPDGAIDRVIPASKRVVLRGRPGTLIFCDTAGLHRGGVAQNKARILATAAYVTQASLHGRRYRITEGLLKTLNKRSKRIAASS